GAGHQDEPLGSLSELLDDRRQAQFHEPLDLRRDHADGACDRPALPIDVAAKAREPLDAEGQVELVLLLELLLLPLVQDAIRELLGVRRRELLELHEGDELAVHTKLWMDARRDVQVGGGAFDQNGQQIMHRDGHRLLALRLDTRHVILPRRMVNARSRMTIGCLGRATFWHHLVQANATGRVRWQLQRTDVTKNGNLRDSRGRTSRLITGTWVARRETAKCTAGRLTVFCWCRPRVRSVDSPDGRIPSGPSL